MVELIFKLNFLAHDLEIHLSIMFVGLNCQDFIALVP